MNFKELQAQSPSKQCRLDIEERTEGEKFALGGNDFSLISKSDCLSKKEVRKELLGYSDGNKLYLNGWKMKLQNGYARVVAQGAKFLAFYGAVTNDETINAGMMGGLIGGLMVVNKKYLYVVDLKTGKLYYATPEYLQKMLAADTGLQAAYNSESVRDSDEIMLKYINLSNQAK